MRDVGEGLIGERLSVFLGRPRLQGLPAVLETLGHEGKGGEDDMRELERLWRARHRRLIVRVAVVDPQAYTLPYDDELCRALAAAGRRGRAADGALHARRRRPSRTATCAASCSARRSRACSRAAPRSRARVPLKAGRARCSAWRAWCAACAPGTRTSCTGSGRPRRALDLRALRAARRDAGATVFTAHDVLPRRSRDAAPLWAELYASCDRVIVHGAASRDRLLVEVGGVTPERIAVIPHALLHAGARPPRAPEQAEPRLLFFGLIRPDKGLDLLIEALPAVAQRVPDVRLDVVGSPRMPIEPLRARARRSAWPSGSRGICASCAESEVPRGVRAARA